MESYQHLPLPDPSSYIRLLTVISIDGEVTCDITTHPVNELPPYFALSYTWGSGAAVETVTVNSKSLAVSAHLLEGLRQLPHVTVVPRIWIDAICINQQDDAEKAHQIPLMGSIYSKAHRVLVWLGKAENDSDLAITAIPKAYDWMRSKTDKVNLKLGTKNLATWKSIAHLFSRSWFHRLWVLQEIVLAQGAFFICGSKHIGLQKLYQFATEAREADLVGQIGWSEEENGLINGVDVVGFDFFKDLHRLREECKAHNVDSVSLLDYIRSKKVQEPVDRVYGMLGIVTDWLKDSIVVDYSQTVKDEYWKLYLKVGKLALREKGVGILDFVEALNPHPELPSWCPDWSSPRLCSGLPNIYHVACLDDNGSEIDASQNGVLSSDTDSVSFNGFELDTIIYLSELVWKQTGNDEEWAGSTGHAAENLSMIDNNFDNYIHLYSKYNGELTPEDRETLFFSYARTLIVDAQDNNRRWGSERYKGDVFRDLNSVRKWLSGWKEDDDDEKDENDEREDINEEHEEIPSVANVTLTNNIIPSRTSTPGSDSTSSTVEDTEYSNYCQSMWPNRCFFITSSMKIGLVPETCEVGDAIVILFGGSYPFVLRRQPEKSLREEHFKFIGCSYVDGIMYGEAMAMRDTSKDRAFLIS